MAETRYFRFGEYTLDVEARRLLKGEQELQFVAKPNLCFKILIYFLQNPQRVVTRAEILEWVWEGESKHQGNVKAVIYNIRTAFKDNKRQQIIKTKGKQGWIFLPKVTPMDRSWNLTAGASVAAKKDDRAVQDVVLENPDLAYGYDEIVPFKVSLEESRRAMLAWLIEGEFTPDNILAETEFKDVQRRFFPYYTFVGSYSVQWTARAGWRSKKLRGETKVVFPPIICSAFNFPSNLTKVWSSRQYLETRSLSSSFSPEKKEYLEPFSRPLHKASQVELREKANQHAKYHVYLEVLKQRASVERIRIRNLQINDQVSARVYLPVYILTYAYNDEVFHIISNGYVEKTCEGTRPVDTKRKEKAELLSEIEKEWYIWPGVLLVFIAAVVTKLTGVLVVNRFTILLLVLVVGLGFARGLLARRRKEVFLEQSFRDRERLLGNYLGSAQSQNLLQCEECGRTMSTQGKVCLECSHAKLESLANGTAVQTAIVVASIYAFFWFEDLLIDAGAVLAAILFGPSLFKNARILLKEVFEPREQNTEEVKD